MKFKLGPFVIIISILVLGCANQHAPKCSDAEIQSAALNIFNEKYKDNARNLYLTASYLSENKMPHGIMGFADSIVELSMEKNGWSDTAIHYDEEVFKDEYYAKTEFISMEEWDTIHEKFNEEFEIENLQIKEAHKKYMEAKELVKPQIIDSLLDILVEKIHLENIRIMNIKDEIKMCECEADVHLDNEKIFELTYSAQYNEEGKIFVSVANDQ